MRNDKVFPIITLCGSSKQKADYEHWHKTLTLQGNCVLGISIYYGVENPNYNEENDTKKLLEAIHRQKIRMADEVVFIMKPDGTLGKHSTEELEYAKSLGKEIRYVYSVVGYE